MFYPARQIVPHVWIGSAGDAADVDAARKRDIQFVINATKDVPDGLKRLGIPVMRIPIDDHFSEGDALLKQLPEAVVAIDAVAGRGRGVLVHCYAGMQRSAAVVCAYLMYKYRYPKHEAMRRIQQKKPETFTPRPTFGVALRKWQQTLGIENR